jgi:hypothetical protein
VSELNRCPFCSSELMPNTNQDDLYVRRYGTHWVHPDGPCFLDGTEVSPSQVDAWNRRATEKVADVAPVAQAPDSGALRDALNVAYADGWSVSGEGYNGEYTGSSFNHAHWTSARDKSVNHLMERLAAPSAHATNKGT